MPHLPPHNPLPQKDLTKYYFNQNFDAYGYNAFQVDWLEQETAAQVVFVGSRNDDGTFHVAGWLVLTYVHPT